MITSLILTLAAMSGALVGEVVTNSDVLTPTEATQLAELESVIERGLETFVEVGNALLEIRNGRLYRVKYQSFEIYCRERWGLARRRAYQIMEAAAAVQNFSHPNPPANEAQARELAKVPEQIREEVWERALNESAGKPTAAVVRKAANDDPQLVSPEEFVELYNQEPDACSEAPLKDVLAQVRYKLDTLLPPNRTLTGAEKQKVQGLLSRYLKKFQ